jgi:hypothetical protein
LPHRALGAPSPRCTWWRPRYAQKNLVRACASSPEIPRGGHEILPTLPNQRLGTTHGGTGDWGGPWRRWLGPRPTRPPGHAKPGYALGNESPGARSAGGCQVVGAGPRPRSWVATGPKPKTEARGGAGGAPGPLRGEGRRPAQGLPFKPHNIKLVRLAVTGDASRRVWYARCARWAHVAAVRRRCACAMCSCCVYVYV